MMCFEGNERRQIGDLKFMGTSYITPSVASKLLKHNFSNRRLNQQRVNAYARDMIAGKWEAIADGLSLQFDKNWNLLNGQHRLSAIVQSGVAQEMFIFQKDVESDALTLPFDTGMTRSLGVIMQKPLNYIGLISCLYILIYGTTHMSPLLINNFEDALSDNEKELFNYIASSHKKYFSAAVKAAFFFHGINSFNSFICKEDNIKDTLSLYKACITQNYTNARANKIRDMITNFPQRGGSSGQKETFITVYGMLENYTSKKYKKESYMNEILSQLKTWFINRDLRV